MTKTSLFLTDQQLDRLAKEKERTGISKSEILRRLIDEKFKEYDSSRKIQSIKQNSV